MSPKDSESFHANILHTDRVYEEQHIVQCKMTPPPSMYHEDQMTMECTKDKKKKKHLRWSTITVHEFGIGLGGSSVSEKGGPSIGLSDEPEFTWTTKVGEMAQTSEGVHRFTPDERIRLLRNAGVSDGMILRFARETNIILDSRKRTMMEDVAEEKKSRKRKAEAVVERPCSSFIRRARMIPANYV